MKKLIVVLMSLLMVLALTGCKETPTEPQEDITAKSEGVMTYAEYAAAAVDTPVTIEGYVQGVQSYWNGATIYVQDADGAYFIYNGNITEENYAKLVDSVEFTNGWAGIANGTKIKVTGVKTEWSGEVEIIDTEDIVVYEDHKHVFEATDVTALLGKEELVNKQNMKVAFTGMTVEDYGNGAAFAYKNDTAGDDVYFKVSKDGVVYEFCLESYLTFQGSEAYTAVEGLKIGDTVDLEGFLYWYNGANPHITKVTVK